MKPDMKKRLEAIEDRLASHDKSGVVFLPLKGETEEEMDDRIARWYAGEKVAGQERIYSGNGYPAVRIRFVKSVNPFAS